MADQPAELHWFADESRSGSAIRLRVFLEHPSDLLFACIDIRSHDVTIRPNQCKHSGHIFASEPFTLTHRQVVQVANHAALCAAERNIRESALPCHRKSKGTQLLDVDTGVHAETSKIRAACVVVLDSK